MSSDGKSSHCLWQGELKTSESQIPVIAHMIDKGNHQVCSNRKPNNLKLWEQ
jgi:hypothetical protein